MDTSNEDHTPTPTPLETMPNYHSTTSNPPTPLGILSILPRELRDEIYLYLHNQRFFFHSPDSHQWRSRVRKILPAMRLSTAIRDEFLAIRCTDTVFDLSDWGSRGNGEIGGWTGTCERGELLYLDRIQHVLYRVRLSLETYNWARGGHFGSAEARRRDDERTRTRNAEPISFLTGTEVLRNSCLIPLSPFTPKLEYLLQSPFMNAVKGLIGFKTVTLETFLVRSFYLPDGVDATNHATRLRAFMDALRATLEGSLGPGVISEVSKMRIESELVESKITFRPRDYYASKEKNLKSDSSAQADQGNESLPRDCGS